MEIKDKNLILFFLGQQNLGCDDDFEKVIASLMKIAKKYGVEEMTQENRIFMDLEQEILDFYVKIRRFYFDCGVSAETVLREYNLEFTN